jgi:hypothetical protein
VGGGLRCAPAEIANGRRGVGDALIGGDAVGGDALELAGVDLNDGIGGLSGRLCGLLGGDGGEHEERSGEKG